MQHDITFIQYRAACVRAIPNGNRLQSPLKTNCVMPTTLCGKTFDYADKPYI